MAHEQASGPSVALSGYVRMGCIVGPADFSSAGPAAADSVAGGDRGGATALDILSQDPRKLKRGPPVVGSHP